MPEQLTRHHSPPTSTAAAVPVQRSGAGGVHAGLRGHELPAQSAMLEPVQRREAVGARPPGPVQMHVGPGRERAVQRMVVQREENPTEHREAALEQVRSSPVPATEGAGQNVTVPRDFDSYCAHMRTTFAAEIAEIRAINEEFRKKGGEIKLQEEALELDEEEVNYYRYEFKTKGALMDAEDAKRKAALDAMQVHEGKTMEDLYNEAKALLEKHGNKKIKAKEETDKLELLMMTAMELAAQINPEGSGKSRELYQVKIDNGENQRLVKLAEEQGMPLAELGPLAVRYRTWSKTFVRTEIMEHEQTAEILFMRDLGLDGLQIGKTPEGLAQSELTKIRANLKQPPIPFDEAEEAQQLETYKVLIEKAKKTNPNVNASMGERKRRPLSMDAHETGAAPALEGDAHHLGQQGANTPRGNGGGLTPPPR